jgi:hypothetical protein
MRRKAPEFYTHSKRGNAFAENRFNYISPNPANTEIRFDFSMMKGEKIVSIFNSIGEKISLLKFQAEEINPILRTDDFPPGIYYLTLYLDNVKTQTDHVVIIH